MDNILKSFAPEKPQNVSKVLGHAHLELYCENCGKTFTTLDDLSNHRKEDHELSAQIPTDIPLQL